MKETLLLLSAILSVSFAASYTLEGIFPNNGPTTGETRVSIYSPQFKGMNYTDHPTPKCQFAKSEPTPANWIHCYGSATNPSAERDQTCLNCESAANAAGKISVKVSLTGDFSDTVSIDFIYYEQPEVEYLIPPLGYKTGGTFVQVHGKNFGNFPSLNCGFGTVNVPATYVSPTLITCKSPSSDVVDSPIPLRVTQNNQQYTPVKVNYYYYNVPEISQLIPDEGPVSGGTEVYIVGRQMYPFQNAYATFENTTFVRFGPDHYAKLELINKTHAKAISPPSLSGAPVSVEITFNDQEWTQNGIQFKYYISPYVVKLVPNLGLVEGGTNITVVGANFYNSSEIQCKFGDNIVPGHYINDSSVWCVTPTPNAPGTKDFSLSFEKNHFSGNSVKYTYIQQPTISRISPQCGPTTGQTQIAVSGQNFVDTGVNKVFCIFGADIYQPATVISDSLIYCDSPSVLDKFGNNVNDTSKLHFKLTLNEVEIVDTKFDFTYYTMPQILSIEPKVGPTTGGTKIIVNGNDFSKSCSLTCKFATYEVPATLINASQVSCTAPTVTCPGDSVVQVSSNGQQYTQNDYTLQDAVFTHYEAPVVAYALPTSFPTNGNSSLGVYGNGFLLSKNSSTLASGATKVSYTCRFKNTDTNTMIGSTVSSYFTDSYIYCKTPQLDNPTTNVGIEISPNGQLWVPVPATKLSFYNSPAVTSVEPSFGKVKQKDAKLTVRGKYFECPDDDCTNVKCSFTGPSYKITTNGSRQSSDLVYCDIPSVSRPDVTQVQVTMNGVDFTTQPVTYTFYDAFVVNLDPAFIPVEGNVPVKVNGLGFADTPQLKVRLEDSKDGTPLSCGNGAQCVLPATFVSSSQITFTAPPQNKLITSAGEPLGYRPFNVEASVYEDSFTQNGVQLNYFQQPDVTGELSVIQASYEFHANGIGALYIAVDMNIPEGVRTEEFLRKTRISCKYDVGGQSVLTEGKVVQYPYPQAVDLDVSSLSVECTTPKLSKTGKGTISVSLDGVNYLGNLPINVLPQLTVNSVEPRCGPREGGTNVKVAVGGIQTVEYEKFFFSWSTVCTDPFKAAMFTQPNQVSTVTPPAPVAQTAGGYSLVSFSTVQTTAFQDKSAYQQRNRNVLDVYSEFLYYQKPTVTRIYPHGGIYTGGTPVTVEGAFFFENKKFACSPKCKFGDTLVDAQFISTVRIRCNAPPGTLGAFVPVKVTFNGQDEAISTEPQTFGYTGRPNVQSISPVTGPSSGGTMLTVTGQGFVDMSKYPDEFACIFNPVDKSEDPKVVPAVYLNSTAIACSTPGGWNAGTTTDVELSFNGVDFSNNHVQFKFYQVDKVWPLSGPSTGGSLVTVAGSGLVPEIKKGNAACRIGGVTVKAQTAASDKIECLVPPAAGGPTYHGNVDFYYTLDGEKWDQVMQGFVYYQQPDVTQIIPKYVAANGGKLKVKGNNFRANFYGSELTCRINNATVKGEYVDNNQINCPFNDIDINNQKESYVEVALNGASFTPKSDASKIIIYKISSVNPASGIREGGTQLMVNGVNFPKGSIPLCKFGVQARSAVSYGSYINDHQITCTAPAIQLSEIHGDPMMVPFTLGFDSDSNETLDRAGLHYYYYDQPKIKDISPVQVPVEQSLLVTITSEDHHPFNNSIIGSNLVQQNSYLGVDIICKFGRFGSTAGALLAFNQIGCPTPITKISASDIGEEAVDVQIALNGQDFTTVPQKFKFVGSKKIVTSSADGATWIMMFAIGAAILAIVVSFLSRMYPPFFSKEKIPLVAHMTKSDDIATVTDIATTRVIT